jgi:hypothetical protein
MIQLDRAWLCFLAALILHCFVPPDKRCLRVHVSALQILDKRSKLCYNGIIQ